MKNTKRLLAVLLVLAMVLSCLPLSAMAAGKSAIADAAPAASQKAQLGFKSTAFREGNSYRYAADETVRAIIVMDGAPAGEATGSRAAAKARLAAQHDSLRKSMNKLSYTELFEYDSLLNGLAVETVYGNLDAISEMPGVKAVYIANHYDLPHYDIKMDSSNEMTGLSVAHQYGITGSGTVIAILDTGMTAGHEAFKVYDGMLAKAAISEADAKAFVETRGYGTYVSQKIPFAYDYADVDDNAEDSTNGHGPHVSGIAAGYAEDPDGAITFMGAAPDAQLLEMKIFNDVSEGTDSSIYFAALEDAYELGADVINMSIGAQNGFTYDPELENEVYGNMYEILEKAGVVCSISAGNEYSMAHNASNWAGDGYVTSDYADYGTLGSPATYDGNMSIASLENAQYPTNYLQVGDLKMPYYDSDENFQFYNAMNGVEANFVDCGFGYVEDFENVDVYGKIALMSRGDITFQEKVDNAAAAGAIAALVYNNEDGVIYMSIDPYAIPAASLEQKDGLALLALLEGGETKGVTAKPVRETSKPAKRGDDDEVITAIWAELPENGAPVVLYSEKDGAIMAYSATTEDDGEHYTAWNQNTEPATVEGTKLTAAWDDAGILYAIDMEDGTWAFVDEYYYDYYEEMYCLYNDGDLVGTIGDPESDGTFCYYQLESTANGYLFMNVGSGLYLTIKDGLFYDTENASEATPLAFYVVGGDEPIDPVDPIDPVIDPEAPIMTFPVEQMIVDNPEAWLMSDYSCWGATPSLTLKPTITGVGGDVNSVNFNTEDGYTIYSGTSMAAPNVSGFMATLLGYLMEAEDLTKVERAAKAEAIAESTAWVLEDADGYIYSPRKQGSGLIDAISALSTEAYITDPIKDLFDSVDGEFEFTFTVKNDGADEITYAVTPLAMYDYADYADWSEEEDGSDIRWYNTLTADYLTETDCTVDAPETVTVPAGGTADVTVKIKLTDETKAYFDEIFPNGNYIEGYVFLTADDDYTPEIHATYMGFYGDWTKAPIMEQHDWREVVDIDTWLQTEPADDEGNTYYDYGYTYFDVADFEVNTDINLAYALNYDYLSMGQLYGGYAGDNLFDYAPFNEKHIAISEGEDGICDTLYMMPMNLRNCRHMIMVVTNAETGEVYYVDDTEYLPKAIWDEDYGYWSNTGTFMWDGTDLNGNVLATDTVVDITYYCNLAYGEDKLGDIEYADLKTAGTDYVEWAFKCTVDNDAPEFTWEYDEATETLTVTATDSQYVADISLYYGDELVDSASFSEDEAGKTVTAIFENVPTDAAYELDVADYASNIVAKEIALGDVPTATVTFIVPEGCALDADAEITVVAGGTVIMPYLYGEVDGGYFVAWITEPIDGVLSSDDLYADEYAWIWDEMLFEGDEFTVTEDTVFYPLIERPTDYADPHEELALVIADREDWSGVWAFDGYDWTADDITDYILSSDLSAYAITEDGDTYIEYGYFGDGYLYGAKDEHLFEIEVAKVYTEPGVIYYTIKNADGKYLAIDEAGKLILTDDANTANAVWEIWFDIESYCNIIWNCGADYVLLFNEETGEFGAFSVDEAVIDEPMNLYMFGASAGDYEYFTAEAGEPAGPTEPIETEATEPIVPPETEPVETEPVETEPFETEPVETEPVETEPIETEPVETEPIETEPVETEPVETEATEPIVPPETEPIDTEASCAHESTEIRGYVAATCEEPGFSGDLYCVDCGEKIAEGTVIEALGHDWNAGEPVAPTCTEDGYTPYTCSRCDAEENRDIVPATGHADADEDGKCDECGADMPEPIETDPIVTETEPVETEATEPIVPPETEPVETEATEPIVPPETEPVETEPVETEPIETEPVETEAPCAHENTEIRDAVDATCLDPGYSGDTYCVDCGEKIAEGTEIEALGHDWNAGEPVAPTCTEDGYTPYTCSRCDAEENRDIVPATGHADADEDGKCDACGADMQPKDPCEGYTDIDRSSWYHEAVDFVIARGIMSSTTTDSLVFEPFTVCTRAMIAQMLYSLEGKPEVEYEAAFPDVMDDQWFTDAVMWAYKSGVFTGYDNGNFGPNDKVTREQMAVILKAYAELVKGIDTSKTADLTVFPDYAKVKWSEPYITWAVAEGLISGKTQNGVNYLDPQGNATRAEVAAIMRSFITNIIEAEPAETEPTETEPTETEPVETEPVETEPVETEPAETEPVETEPVETAPVETEPVEITPAD